MSDDGPITSREFSAGLGRVYDRMGDIAKGLSDKQDTILNKVGEMAQAVTETKMISQQALDSSKENRTQIDKLTSDVTALKLGEATNNGARENTRRIANSPLLILLLSSIGSVITSVGAVFAALWVGLIPPPQP